MEGAQRGARERSRLGGGRRVGVRFHRPDGRVLSEVPELPAVPEDAVEALERAHGERGIEPDGWTATPLWWGEPLDINLALDMHRRPGIEMDKGSRGSSVEGTSTGRLP